MRARLSFSLYCSEIKESQLSCGLQSPKSHCPLGLSWSSPCACLVPLWESPQQDKSRTTSLTCGQESGIHDSRSNFRSLGAEGAVLVGAKARRGLPNKQSTTRPRTTRQKECAPLVLSSQAGSQEKPYEKLFTSSGNVRGGNCTVSYFCWLGEGSKAALHQLVRRGGDLAAVAARSHARFAVARCSCKCQRSGDRGVGPVQL